MLLMVFTVAAGAYSANAQSTDIFGGFAGGAMKPEHDDRFTVHGWNASLTRYFNSRFGVTADFAGLYGDFTQSGTSAAANETIATRQYSFMGGPQVRIIHKDRFETSFKVLVGGVHGYLPDGVLPAGATFNETDQNALAAAFGSNLDFRISRKVSLRVSPGFYLTRFGTEETQKNFRFSIGPVFHFGGREN
jgi:hypothetical protein